MSRRLAGGRRLACLITLICLAVELCPAAAGSRPASRLERVMDLGFPGLLPVRDDPNSEPAPRHVSASTFLTAGDKQEPDSSSALAGRHRRTRGATIVGTGLFATGLFLCSWGITSWQRQEDQCCPPRNTENVIKITVGLVLVDAGLVYLLGGVE